MIATKRCSTSRPGWSDADSDEVRKILQPKPVRLHHMPNWFRFAVLRALPAVRGVGMMGDNSTYEAHLRIAHAFPNLHMDHDGASDGAFVSEPYDVTPECLRGAENLAKRIDCEFRLSPNSWWFPGQTLRMEWFRREK